LKAKRIRSGVVKYVSIAQSTENEINKNDMQKEKKKKKGTAYTWNERV